MTSVSRGNRRFPLSAFKQELARGESNDFAELDDVSGKDPNMYFSNEVAAMDALICPGFIATCCERVGIEPVAKSKLHEITPNDLDASGKLHDVSARRLRCGLRERAGRSGAAPGAPNGPATARRPGTALPRRAFRRRVARLPGRPVQRPVTRDDDEPLRAIEPRGEAHRVRRRASRGCRPAACAHPGRAARALPRRSRGGPPAGGRRPAAAGRILSREDAFPPVAR